MICLISEYLLANPAQSLEAERGICARVRSLVEPVSATIKSGCLKPEFIAARSDRTSAEVPANKSESFV